MPLLKEIKHFELKCRERSKSLSYSVWFQKGSTEKWWENLFIGKLPEEDQVKKKQDITRDTPHLIQDNQKNFKSMTDYYSTFS